MPLEHTEMLSKIQWNYRANIDQCVCKVMLTDDDDPGRPNVCDVVSKRNWIFRNEWIGRRDSLASHTCAALICILFSYSAVWLNIRP